MSDDERHEPLCTGCVFCAPNDGAVDPTAARSAVPTDTISSLTTGAVYTIRGAAAASYALTVEQCVAAGGHCHRRTGMTRASIPPQYGERCPHCGHERWAIPREPFEYRDAP